MSRAEAKAAIGIPDDGDLVGLIGRVVPWKGTQEFINAMAVLAERRPDARFLIVGDASESPTEYIRVLQAKIDAAGLRPRVTFIDHLADIYAAYRACSVVAHASIEPEPFGMVIVEAMQAGTPVVAACTGGPTEIIEHGVSGMLADPRDAGAFAAAVLRLIEEASFRERVAAAARDVVARRFNAAAAVEGILGVYDRAVGEAARARSHT